MVQVQQLRGTNAQYLQGQSNLNNVLANIYSQQQQTERNEDTVAGAFKRQLLFSGAPILGQVLGRNAQRKQAQANQEAEQRRLLGLMETIGASEGYSPYQQLTPESLPGQKADGTFELGVSKRPISPQEEAFRKYYQVIKEGGGNVKDLAQIVDWANLTADEKVALEANEFDLSDKKVKQPLELEKLRLDNEKKRKELLNKGGAGFNIKLGDPVPDLSGQFFLKNIVADEATVSYITSFNALSKSDQSAIRRVANEGKKVVDAVNIINEMQALLEEDSNLYRRFVEASNTVGKVTTTDPKVARLNSLNAQLKKLGLVEAVATLGAQGLSDKDASAFQTPIPSVQDTLPVFKEKANLYKKNLLGITLDSSLKSQAGATFNSLIDYYESSYGKYTPGGTLNRSGGAGGQRFTNQAPTAQTSNPYASILQNQEKIEAELRRRGVIK